MKTARLFLVLTVLGILSSSAVYSQGTAPWEYWKDTPVPIADFSTATSTIIVPDNFIISDMEVLVDIDHSAAGDLLITLTGPYGFSYVLSQYNGGVYDHYQNTIFDPTVTTGTAIPGLLVNAPTNQNAGFRGIYRPQSGTTFPTGVSGQGTWTLQVYDNQMNDVGSLKKWGIMFNRYAKYKDVRFGIDLNALGTAQRYPAPFIDDVTTFSPSGLYPYRVHGYRPENGKMLSYWTVQNSKMSSLTRFSVSLQAPGGSYVLDLDNDYSVNMGMYVFGYAPVLPQLAGDLKMRGDLYQRADLFATRNDNRTEKTVQLTAGSLGYDNGTAAGTTNIAVNGCEGSVFRIETAQTLTSVDVWQGSSVELEPPASPARVSIRVYDATSGAPASQVTTSGLRAFPKQGNKWVSYDFTPAVNLAAGTYAFVLCTEVAPTIGGTGFGCDREGSPFNLDGTFSRYYGLGVEFFSTNAGTTWNSEFLRTYGGKMIRPNFITGTDVGVISIDYPPASLPNSFAPQVTFGSFGNHPYLPNAVTLGKLSVIDNATKQVVRYSERRVFLQNAPYTSTVTFDNFTGLTAGSYTIQVVLDRSDDENYINNTYSRTYTKTFAPTYVNHSGPISAELRASIDRAVSGDVIYVDRSVKGFSLPKTGNVLWIGDVTSSQAQSIRSFVEEGNAFSVIASGMKGDVLTSVYASLANTAETKQMNDVIATAKAAHAPEVFVSKQVEDIIFNSPTIDNPAAAQIARQNLDMLKARISQAASMAKSGVDERTVSFNQSENLVVNGDRLGDLPIVRVVATTVKKPQQVVEAIVNPTSFELTQNYPNPFNPTTNIAYNLPSAASVNLRVYDMLGRQVATLVSSTLNAGRYIATWDGLDNSRQSVASGVYLYRLEAMPVDGSTPFVLARKMVLAR